MADHSSAFTELLTGHQQRLYRYIVSLLGNPEAAWDVLQETNRVLLEKQEQFQPGTSFANWALTIAQFQTRAWLRDRGRDRVIATPEIVELMADDAQRLADESDPRQTALAECLKKMAASNRELLHQRYALSRPLSEMAASSGRSVGALKQLFFRLRGSLQECIELRLEAE